MRDLVIFIISISLFLYWAIESRINKARDVILARLGSLEEQLDAVQEKLAELDEQP